MKPPKNRNDQTDLAVQELVLELSLTTGAMQMWQSHYTDNVPLATFQGTTSTMKYFSVHTCDRRRTRGRQTALVNG